MIATSVEEVVLVAACLTGATLFGREARKSRAKRQQGTVDSAANAEESVKSAQPETAGEPPEIHQPPGLYAVFDTSYGRIVCKLFPDQAPITVRNFTDLAQGKKRWRNAAEKKWEERPYYNGLTFHRVIPKFMIQGGDYMGNGTGSVGYTFEDEFAEGFSFDRPGLLAMANAGPNTNGAQFFITVEPTPWLDRKHTIFGETVEGRDVANAICKTARDVRDRPLKPAIIRTVTIVDTRLKAS